MSKNNSNNPLPEFPEPKWGEAVFVESQFTALSAMFNAKKEEIKSKPPIKNAPVQRPLDERIYNPKIKRP